MQALTVALLALFISSVSGQQTTAQFINDNNVLNYALTLENLEAALYNQGLAKFGSNDAQYTAAGYPVGTYAALQLIATQETGHASALTSVLGSRGWPAVPACTYNFGTAFNSVTNFVSFLAVVENLGTSAYIGASSGLTSGDLLQIAAGIATVEARHTAILATLTNTSYAAPFPNVQDPGYTPDFVLGQAVNYIVSCPQATLNVPYASNPSVTVNSSVPSTYTFQNSATVRGNTTVMAAPSFYASTPAGQAAQANDFAVLNYALTLEYLEAFFYANFSSVYSASNIQAAYPNANASIVSQSIALIAQHEAFHVSFLRQVLGSSATQNCSYNFAPLGLPFGSTNFGSFLSVANTLENTGVSAYVGAIRLLVNPNIAAIAAGIATVEARHASYIGDLVASNSTIFGPTAKVTFNANTINTQIYNDNAQTPSQVATLLTSNGILFGCPSTNPPVYGLGALTNNNQNFFGDNATPQGTNPFAAAGGGAGTPSSSTSTITSTSATTPVNTRTTGAASSVAASFAVLALVAALLF